MHISEQRVNPTFINCVIKVYEIKQGALDPYDSTGSLKIQF